MSKIEVGILTCGVRKINQCYVSYNTKEKIEKYE